MTPPAPPPPRGGGRRRSPFWAHFDVLPSRKARPDARARCCGALLVCAQPERDLVPHLAACARVDGATRARAQQALDQAKTQSRGHDGATATTKKQKVVAVEPPPTGVDTMAAKETQRTPRMSQGVGVDSGSGQEGGSVAPSPHVIPVDPRPRVFATPAVAVPVTPGDPPPVVCAAPATTAHAISHKIHETQEPTLSDQAPLPADERTFHALVASAVDTGALPFAIVEHPAFVHMIQMIRPDLSVPSRRELADLLCERGQADRSERRALYR